MKVAVLSDIHLEFGDYHPGDGDVLVLAGDIATACSYSFRGEDKFRERYDLFFERCVEGFNKVFYVMGNHEHYNHFFNETDQILRENLPAGITLLNDQSEFYNGWHFVGSTLWSNFQGKDPNSMAICQGRLNDYQSIHVKGEKYRRLTTTDTLTEHEKSVKWLNQCLPTLNGPIFMISHHCPSFLSIEESYTGSDTIGAYASNLEGLIRRHENVKVWAHGHVHGSNSYLIDGCHIISNPRGYCGYEENFGFDPYLEVDLENYV